MIKEKQVPFRAINNDKQHNVIQIRDITLCNAVVYTLWTWAHFTKKVSYTKKTVSKPV